MISTMFSNRKNSKIKLWAAAVWLIVWQFASTSIGQEILLVSPVTVIERLFELVRTAGFWQSLEVPFCGSWPDFCWEQREEQSWRPGLRQCGGSMNCWSPLCRRSRRCLWRHLSFWY